MSSVLGCDALEGAVDGFNEKLVGSGLLAPQRGLDLAPHLFDGIEIGRVGGQELDARADGGDEVDGGLVFVGTEVVHDNDIAGAKHRQKHLANIGTKDFRIGCSFDGHRSRGPIQANGGDHRRRPPVPVRSAADQPLATGAAPAQAGHVRFCRRLVDEDEPGGIKSALPPPPSLTRPFDIDPVLLAGVQTLFLYVSPIFESA